MNASDLAKTQSAMVQPNQSELAKKEKGFLSSLGDLAKTNAGAGILSGLATGLIGGIATGDFGGAFDAGLQGGAHGMQRLDQLEKERANRLLLEQKVAQDSALKGNFGTVFEDARRKGLLTDDAAKDIQLNWLKNQAKDPYSLQQQQYASQYGAGLGKLETAGQLSQAQAMGTQRAKQIAGRESAQKQLETLMPRVEQAIGRAKDAANQGRGLGQVEGQLWTTSKGGENRADINNAQAQINILMRGLLSEMGVGSTELNSAAEAAAYRYQINPDMPESQILRIMQNFEDDYKSGALEQQVGVVASQYGGSQPTQQSSGSKYKVISVR